MNVLTYNYRVNTARFIFFINPMLNLIEIMMMEICMSQSCYAMMVTRLGPPDVMQYQVMEMPEPKDHEVLIEQTAVGVNFVDIYLRAGQAHAHNPEPPFITGVHAVGIVKNLGSKVSEVQVGDRVTYTNAGVGTYCSHVTVASDRLVVVPNNVSDERCAAGFVRVMTAQYLLKQMRPLHTGDKVLIHAAAGGTGQVLVQWAKRMGLEVFATAGSEEKIRFVKELGADHVINYRTSDFAQEVGKITHGKGVKVVFESVGKDTFMGSLECLEPKGLAINFGTASGQVENFALQSLHAKSLWICRPTLRTYIADKHDLQTMAKEAFEILGDPSFRLDIEAVLPLKEAAKAHTMIESRLTKGAVVLVP
jgi:NADPH2:quinone reductase